MNDNKERVTITVRTREELKALGLEGQESNKRIEKRFQLGLPMNISLRKDKLLETMVESKKAFREYQSDINEMLTGKSVH